MIKRRLNVMGSCFLAVGIVLGAVQLKICIIKGEEYSQNAAMQRTDALKIKNYRGKFYDRNMIPLVENSVSKVNLVNKKTFGKELSNATVTVPVRYSADAPACHLIGYTNAEGKGVSGLEKSFDSFVSASVYDKVNVVKGADGNVIAGAGMSYLRGVGEGDSVVLTLDYHIQAICRDALLNSGVTGAVVVMNVSDFNILAMASTPTYDQNNISDYLNSNRGELVNRCVCPYNAGSIFKIITLCSALENNDIDYLYECSGTEEIENHIFSCHNLSGHGILNPAEALAQSCNCTFYKMGVKLGSERIIKTAKKFGLGSGIIHCTDFNESPGNLPLKDKYAPLDCVNYAIGQGEILLTPVQAANVAAVIANDGTAKKSNIAHKVINSKGFPERILREVGTRKVISSSTARFLQKSMRLAVTEGTASFLKDNPANIAGKTGTAETGWSVNGKNMVHGWFCGFFPADNPVYAMSVLVENGGGGAASAAPVFGEIAEEILKIYPIG